VEADGDIGPGQAFAENVDLAVGVAYPQGALTDETSQQIRQ
jgi:hypothetical protein